MQGWLSILLLTLLGVAFAVGSIVMAFFLGPRQRTVEKEAPYECGMPPVGDARERHSVKFYLVAMIFLLFDIEVAFLYPWAMAIRDLRWIGFVQVLVFFVILVAGYAYVWKKGVLDWNRTS
jgi:NADH-quinone oxidoreductase subunit A